MHINIVNPNDSKEVASACIDRESMSSHVLSSNLDQLNDLAEIAKAQGVPETRLVVVHNDELHRELEALGWKQSDRLIVYVKN